MQQLQFGIDVLLQQPSAYKHLRLALVTNNAATTSAGVLSRVALVRNGFNLCKLFSPEHGIGATGDDGAFQHDTTDKATGLPVISLYGDKMAPAEDLENIDVCMFDIPDVGGRFYTYLWTMTYVMEACAKFQKPFVVFDRPNPGGADLRNTEGPMLDELNCASFIGRWNIPLKHCCTLGELALYFAGDRMKQLTIDVIRVANYQRQYTALDDFSFTPTSPAIQDAATAMLYPGTGLLEGINVNEGRGTKKPFKILGAPWIDADELQEVLQQRLSGVDVIPVRYKPVIGMYANEHCNGVELLLTDTQNFYAVRTGITILQTLQQLYPQQLTERLYKTHANPTGTRHLDKLLGVKDAFQQLQQGYGFITDVKDEWTDKMREFLLY